MNYEKMTKKEINRQDKFLIHFLNCGLYDLNTLINVWWEKLENHNLDFGDVLDYLNVFWEIKLDFNVVMAWVFELLLQNFWNENNLELEVWKDYNIDLSYYCSDIYFTDDKLQDKFDKWL